MSLGALTSTGRDLCHPLRWRSGSPPMRSRQESLLASPGNRLGAAGQRSAHVVTSSTSAARVRARALDRLVRGESSLKIYVILKILTRRPHRIRVAPLHSAEDRRTIYALFRGLQGLAQGGKEKAENHLGIRRSLRGMLLPRILRRRVIALRSPGPTTIF